MAHLCSLCSNVTAEALASEKGYSHAKSPEKLAQTDSLARGCESCDMLGSHYRENPIAEQKSEGIYDTPWRLQKNLRLHLGSWNANGIPLRISWISGLDSEESMDLNNFWILTPPGENMGIFHYASPIHRYAPHLQNFAGGY